MPGSFHSGNNDDDVTALALSMYLSLLYSKLPWMIPLSTMASTACYDLVLWSRDFRREAHAEIFVLLMVTTMNGSNCKG